MVYDRAHTRQIGELSGLAHRMPFIATMMVVAGLAVRIAFGEFERADKRGALDTIVRQPFGRIMLVLLAVGFAAYAASCFVKAASGAAEGLLFAPFLRAPALC